MLGPNDPAPNFSGTIINGGGTFNLGIPSNDVVVVALVSDTVPDATNKELLSNLETIWSSTSYPSHGVRVVAVYCGSNNQTAAVSWLGTIPGGITFPVIMDDSANTIRDDYAGITSPPYPLLFIIDRDRKVNSYHGGSAESAALIENYIRDAIYLREPADIELVMDVSGSMNSLAPGSTSSKLHLMQDAADMVVSFLRDNGQPGDGVGLVYFSYHASVPTSFYSPGTASDYTTLHNGIIGTTAVGCTAMGAGLQEAFEALQPSTNDRFAILLTDGMQNRNPMIEWVGSQIEFTHSAAAWCGDSFTPVSGNDIVSYNTRVHTIGVGITGIYGGLLADIASETGGFYLGTNNPAADLDLIYFVDLCNCLAGGSPAVVHHHAGIYHRKKCHLVETFQVNSSIRKFTAILSWERALTGDLSFSLRAPDGTLLDLHSEMKLFNNYAMATIYLPNEKDGKELPYVGEWEMIIGGVTDENAAPYHAIVIGEDPDLRFTFDFPRKAYKVGDIVPLTVSLTAKDYHLSDPKDIILEYTTLPMPIDEILADYKANPELLTWLTNNDCEELKLDSIEMKLESLALDPRMQDKITPVSKSYSLRDRKLELKIDDGKMILPVKLTQPGLNSFRITAIFDSKKTGPVTRVSMACVHAVA